MAVQVAKRRAGGRGVAGRDRGEGREDPQDWAPANFN